MMQKVATDKAPAAFGPYSQAVRSGNMVFVSGQIPVDPATGSMPDDIRDQARQAFTNLKSILDAAGTGTDRVVRTTVYLTDLSNFDLVNKVYAEFFTDPYPSRSCVEVSKLPKGAKLEIDAIAVTE